MARLCSTHSTKTASKGADPPRSVRRRSSRSPWLSTAGQEGCGVPEVQARVLDTTRHLGARWLDRIRSTSSEDKVHETQASGLSWAAPRKALDRVNGGPTGVVNSGLRAAVNSSRMLVHAPWARRYRTGTALVFGNQLRVEVGLPVAWDLQILRPYPLRLVPAPRERGGGPISAFRARSASAFFRSSRRPFGSKAVRVNNRLGQVGIGQTAMPRAAGLPQQGQVGRVHRGGLAPRRRTLPGHVHQARLIRLNRPGALRDTARRRLLGRCDASA